MGVQGTLGSKIFMSDDAIAESVDTAAEFAALDWTEIGLVESFGEFGRQFNVATFVSVAEGRTRKLKADFNDGQMQLTLGQDLSDDGQELFSGAANQSSQDNYGYRIEFNDRPSSAGGPTTVYFRGLPTQYRTQMGAAGAVVKAAATIEVNSDILYIAPAVLYDRFITGSSLAAYELFNGSDAQALDPAITGDALVMVTGDAGTGFAADGTQIIGDTGYTMTSAPMTLEARIKLSAITAASLFFGWTDQKAALEIPIESAASADTLTSNATNAIGFMFDTEMATDNWWLTGVNADSDETAQNAGSAPVADTYATLRIVTNTSGDATFYINGAAVGSVMTTAAATGATLYPTIAASARSTASRTATVDYLYLRRT